MTDHFPRLPRPRGEQAWSQQDRRRPHETVEIPVITDALPPLELEHPEHPGHEPAPRRRGRGLLVTGLVVLGAAGAISAGLTVAAGAQSSVPETRSDSGATTVVQGPQATSTAPSTTAPSTRAQAPTDVPAPPARAGAGRGTGPAAGGPGAGGPVAGGPAAGGPAAGGPGAGR